MLYTYMLNSNQLLVYQFNTLRDGHLLMYAEKHRAIIFDMNLQCYYSFFKDIHLNNFYHCRKTIRNIIQSIIFKIIYH